ncbi:hypothetical protein ACFPRL_34900 [Pseudoclavibacter helvolus]
MLGCALRVRAGAFEVVGELGAGGFGLRELLERGSFRGHEVSFAGGRVGRDLVPGCRDGDRPQCTHSARELVPRHGWSVLRGTVGAQPLRGSGRRDARSLAQRPHRHRRSPLHELRVSCGQCWAGLTLRSRHENSSTRNSGNELRFRYVASVAVYPIND